MNLRDLDYALAVERHRSFTRASEACGVTQATLSAQIRKLEAELDVPLFERDGHTIRVTAAGRTILDYARRITGAAADLVAAAQASRDPFVGPIRLGLIPTLAPYLLPRLLEAAQRRLPAAPLTVSEEPTAALTARVANGELDAALVATDEGGRFVEHALFDETLTLALPADHALAGRASITADDLTGARLLLLAEGHCLRDHALSLCGSHAVVDGHDMRAASLETLLHLVEAGYGLTLVPELCRQSPRLHNGRVVTRRLDDPAAFRRIRLVHRRESPRRVALAALSEALRALAPATSAAS